MQDRSELRRPRNGEAAWEVLKASQKVKATCQSRHPDSSRKYRDERMVFGRYYRVYAHAGFRKYVLRGRKKIGWIEN